MPPDTAVGGIGTYVDQCARVLAARGHDVHVFAGSPTRSGVVKVDGVHVHRVQLPVERRKEFSRAIVPSFFQENRSLTFDVIEGPDFYAEAAGCAAAAPEVPLIVKLHMGAFAIQQVVARTLTPLQRLNKRLRALARNGYPFWHRAFGDNLAEWQHTRTADLIVAPCHAIAEWMRDAWNLSPERMMVVPYPYVPPTHLLQIPIPTQSRVVTFVGRLEIRKGVIDLAAAIPQFLAQCPDWRVRFVGKSLSAPVAGMDMDKYIARRIGAFSSKVEFVGSVPLGEIHKQLADTSISVIPSVWENFPNVCLEAMSAGRAIIASRAGGMPEQLDGETCGVLVPPQKPKVLAGALIKLARNASLRESLGAAARNRVQHAYGRAAIGPLLEDSYHRAVISRQACTTPTQYPAMECDAANVH